MSAAKTRHTSPLKMGVAGRLAQHFQRNAITPLLAMVLLLLGLFAALVTPREEEPQIDVTMAHVIIPFAGASAKDVEALLARPAEQVLSQVPGLDHVYSVSQDGQALISLQFDVGVPRQQALVDLHDTIKANSDWLPPGLGVGQPIVKARGIDDVPVFAVTLSSTSKQSASALRRVALGLEHALKRVPGTRTVTTIGAPGQAVHVLLDPARMRALNVSVGPVIESLQAANLALHAGDLVRDGHRIRIEAGGFLSSKQEIGELMLGRFGGLPVFLKDIAQISDAPMPPKQYVWTMSGSKATQAGEVFPAVTLAVTKKAGVNAVSVTRDLQTELSRLRNVLVPEDIEMEVTRDYGETANQKSNKLIQKLAFATALVIVLVAVALGVREAVVVGVAVILTLTATLFASWAWGFTLNRVSLFALIFSIGILVDDAIVVVENIHRHRALFPGKSLSDILPGAVDEVGGPTILATFTVIAALLPMAFVSGLMGPYMAPIPINASMGMLLSLIIAFVVTPWLAVRLMSGQQQTNAHHELGRVGKVLHVVTGAMLRPFIDASGTRYAGPRWRRRGLTLLVLLLIVGSVSLVGVQAVILKMLPFDNKSEYQVIVDMPPGTALEDTNAALTDMALVLVKDPNVRHVQGYAGTSAPINFNGLVRQYEFRKDPEMGDLQVNLSGKASRKQSSHELAQAMIAPLRDVARRYRARLKVVEVPPGPPVMAPLVVEIYGPDQAGRSKLAARMLDLFDRTDGVVASDSSLRQGAARIRLVVDRPKAAQLGVPVASIAKAAKAAISGVDASYLHDGSANRAIPIKVALPAREKGSLDSLLNLQVSSSSGKSIALGEVVRLEKSFRSTAIHHKNLMPVVYVVGDMGLVDGNEIDSPLYGLITLRESLAEVALPGTGVLAEQFISQPADAWRQYAIKWDGEWQITYETFRDMGTAYAVGLILIYLLVVAQFRSYMTPLIIMAPIPLTIIGVMPGHALLGVQFTATSMIGMIALAGIIVRNSILLVDFIELEIRQGAALRDAVIRSAQVRAQPILLTALAAMLGALFILDDPIFSGLAVSLIFGILVSTLLTLLIIPLLYYLFRRKQHD